MPSPRFSSQEELLLGTLRPAWAEVDLDALRANFDHLRRRVEPARILAVVKADGYGHGATALGRALEAAGVHSLGVALLEEGAELRRAGVTAPVLVLGTARPSQLPLYRRYELTPTVSSLEQLELWQQWARRESEPVGIHLKVDTGMARLGLAPDELKGALEAIRRHPGLRLQGLLSHFADADELESPRNPEQERRFAELVALLSAAERGSAEIHMANSAAALHRPASRHDVVRLGLSLLGLDPAGRDDSLRPVMAVKARVVQVRQVQAGSAVGYGGRWIAPQAGRVGVVPVGYADGYAWRLSDRAEALVGGQRVPVVGAVSMDMLHLDLTQTQAGVGEEVVLLGAQGEEEITARELAERAGTIAYEILCLLGLRLPRRYLQGGTPVELSSRFIEDPAPLR